MRLLITRPREDAAPLAEKLAARGIESLSEPLLVIESFSGPEIDLAGVQAILATSANGVRALAARTPRRDVGLFAVGDATAQAARQAGFKHVESADGDAAALAERVNARLRPEGGALLHASGAQVAGVLARTLEAAGFELRREVLYEARPVEKLSPETVAALKDGHLDGVLFFSPRMAETFVTLIRKARLARVCRGMTAFALSPAVSDAAAGLAWKTVATAPHPSLESLLSMVAETSPPNEDKAAASGGKKDPPGKAADSRKTRAKGRSSVPAAAGAAPEQRKDGAASGAAKAKNGDKVQDVRKDRKVQKDGAEKISVPGAARAATAGVVASLFTLAVVAGALAGAWPFYKPYLAQGIEALRGDSAADPAFVGLKERVAALEVEAETVPDSVEDLERERAELTGRIDGLMDRVANVEESLEGVRSLLATTDLPAEAAEAGRSLEALAQRIERLEADIAATDAGENEALAAAVDEAMARLAGLERAEARAAENQGDAREILLAAGKLRDVLATSAPFQRALIDFRAAATGQPDLEKIAETLAPHAEEGIPTLARVRERFDATARAVTRADGALQDQGWWAGALNRVLSTVTIRRTGEAAPEGSVDAILSKAETALGEGDLITAVAEMESLEGPAAPAAEDWLEAARARLAAERAMTALHVRAVSLLLPGKN